MITRILQYQIIIYQRHVHRRLRSAGIQAELIWVAVDNAIQKPGPVFNAIARAAYESGADYVYRVNDDSQFMNPWAYTLVKTIQVRCFYHVKDVTRKDRAEA